MENEHLAQTFTSNLNHPQAKRATVENLWLAPLPLFCLGFAAFVLSASPLEAKVPKYFAKAALAVFPRPSHTRKCRKPWEQARSLESPAQVLQTLEIWRSSNFPRRGPLSKANRNSETLGPLWFCSSLDSESLNSTFVLYLDVV